MNLGPNIKKLIGHKVALQMIPPGTANPIIAGFKAIMTPGLLSKHIEEAITWIQATFEVIKTAPDNPYGDDDEAIAGKLVHDIEERKRQQKIGLR